MKSQLSLASKRKRNVVLITGAHGFLGQHVVRLLLDESQSQVVITGREAETLFADIAEEPRVLAYHQLDVTNRQSVRSIVQSVRPDVIVNCAAFVLVDEAETQREQAWRTNVTAVEYLAEAARKVDARIVHISSDYVFDGKKVPYEEADTPHPLNYYGRTKLASENVLKTAGIEHTILRTALVYGAAESVKANYPLAVILALQEGHTFVAPTDLYAAPTLVDDVALGIVRVIERERTGLYHICGPEMLSRYDFAMKIARAFNLDPTLISPTTYEEMYRSPDAPRAERPQKSAFVTLKAKTDLSLHLSNVDEGLQVMIRGIQDIRGEVQQFIYE